MKNLFPSILAFLALLVALLAGSPRNKARADQVEASSPPIAYAWGQRVTVYYPDQKKLFVYSELGGNCVYAYTLSTPGGPVTRENCR